MTKKIKLCSGKKKASLTNVSGITGCQHANRSIFILMHKLKSQWIKDLNINSATLKLLEEKLGNSLENMDAGDHFLNIIPVAPTLRATINKWNRPSETEKLL